MANDGGLKYDYGKPFAGILFEDFSKALKEVVKVGTMGAEKYERNSWKTVPNALTRYTDALVRHQIDEPLETYDEESGLHHAAHMAWNALARLELLMEEEQKKTEIQQLLGSTNEIHKAIEEYGGIKSGPYLSMGRNNYICLVLNKEKTSVVHSTYRLYINNEDKTDWFIY